MPARPPDYQPVMIEGLQDQVIAILQRDFAANLATVAGAAPPYSDRGINDYHKLFPDTAFENAPECIVEAVTSVAEQDEQQVLTYTHSLAVIVVIVAQADNEALAQQAGDYARALVMSLGRQWDLDDYWQPLPITYDGAARNTVGMPAGSIKSVMVRSVMWGMKGSQNQQLGRMPTLELEIVTVEA